MDQRARKVKELAFYTEQKARLEARLFTLRGEIRLTDAILDLIRKEKLIEVKSK
jgi:hypothetical protein